MPIDPVTGSIIAAGASTAFNAIAQGSLNRKNRAWTEKMWDRQNAYNHPVENRKRLEEAGINPFYTGLQGTAAGSVSQPSTKAATLDLGGYITAKKLGLETNLNKASVRKLNADAEATEIENTRNRLTDSGNPQHKVTDKDGNQIGSGHNKTAELRIAQNKAKLLENRQLHSVAADTVDRNYEYLKAQITDLNARNVGNKLLQRLLNYLETLPTTKQAKQAIDKALN